MQLLFVYHMTETLCRSCGAEGMQIKTVCGFCKQPINFACSRCGYITDDKVHVDCINAEFLLSTTSRWNNNNNDNPDIIFNHYNF